MVEAGLRGVEFIAINTDPQTLSCRRRGKLDIGREPPAVSGRVDPDIGPGVDEHAR